MILAQADGRPLVDWSWIVENLDNIWDRTLEHLLLTGLAVAVGLVISLGLAAAALRWRRLYQPILAVSSVLYTIPSLAAFAFLVAVFGLFSFATALIPLVTYTLLILVRNIVTGIDGVPESVKEAADGMGYRRVRRFISIELPLAGPVIIAGVRIATVTVVGLVTVTSLLGRGGLGFFILNGFRKSIVFPTEILIGTVLAVVLAAGLDALLLGVERLITPWRREAAA